MDGLVRKQKEYQNLEMINNSYKPEKGMVVCTRIVWNCAFFSSIWCCSLCKTSRQAQKHLIHEQHASSLPLPVQFVSRRSLALHSFPYFRLLADLAALCGKSVGGFVSLK